MSEPLHSLVERINAATRHCTSVNGSLCFESDTARRDAISAAEQLLIAARGPEETLFAIAQQPAQNAALRCLMALGALDALPLNGDSRSLDDLAHAVGAEKTLLGRILRACTSTSLLSETSELRYAHNTLSRTLLIPANRALLTLMYDYIGRGVLALPEFLQARKWKDSGSYADCSFMIGSHTDLPIWEYCEKDIVCGKTFDLGMQSEMVPALSAGKRGGQFPFGKELTAASASGTSDGEDTLTIVDLGGGRGQVLQEIRKNHPELSAARFVLMDLGPVIESAQAVGLPSWIEPVVGSFFEPFPIRGAHVYYLRRCLHNWDDAACKTILFNVANAMDTTRSRLLITDMVVDNEGAARGTAWEDLGMMAIGGIERTERQWRTLLGENGFRVHKIWRDDSGGHATIDARLK
ncbi:S-adenosyl-L-methionine-dependent methyltransferase [Xylaria grammica]|nr:S-adenosyl-L-methionine-dependent methyltransferase [Xylaria grammica]